MLLLGLEIYGKWKMLLKADAIYLFILMIKLKLYIRNTPIVNWFVFENWVRLKLENYI